nr:hypothetical protein [Tanacetum cinerariifolium]
HRIRGLVNRSLMEVVTPILILVWNEVGLIVSLKILIVGHKRKTRWLKNPPSKHLVFEEQELDKQELGKLEVGKSGVDKQLHG